MSIKEKTYCIESWGNLKYVFRAGYYIILAN